MHEIRNWSTPHGLRIDEYETQDKGIRPYRSTAVRPRPSDGLVSYPDVQSPNSDGQGGKALVSSFSSLPLFHLLFSRVGILLFLFECVD